MEEEQRVKAERIKALLAGYYGTGGAPGGAEGGQAGSDAPALGANQSDAAKTSMRQIANAIPATLDSPAFNAERHISHILKTYQLEKLMIEHRNMAREIKNLDSDMQQLVYENYNKFISATDTIRSMKSSVNSMGADMVKLNGIMGNVAEKSSSLSDKLQTRAETMEELQRVQSLLKKLQAVFDLPKKMRAALEEDVLDTAVSFYAEAQPLLRKYGGRGTFRQIAAESDQVAREISQVLKKRLTERKDSEEQCVLLLRKLGEPDDTLQDKYLQGRGVRLRRILKEASMVADVMAACASGDPIPEDLPQFVEAPGTWGFSTDAQHSPSLRAFVKALDEKVINAVQETVLNVLRFFLQEDANTQDAAAAATRRKPLLALAREVFNEYFKILRRVLADSISASVHTAACMGPAAQLSRGGGEELFALQGEHMEFGTDWGADALAQALSTLSADLSLLNSNLPELKLKEHASDIVQQAVFYHLHISFSAVQMRVQGATDGVRCALEAQQSAMQQGMSSGTDHGQVLKKVYSYAAELLHQSLLALMEGLRAYNNHPRLLASWHGVFMDAVQGQLQSFFLSMLSAFLDAVHVQFDGSEQLKLLASTSSTKVAAFSATSEHLELPGLSRDPPHMDDVTGPHSQSTAAKARGEPPKTGLVLMLAKLCTYMEQQTLPLVMEMLAKFQVQGGTSGGGRVGLAAPDDLKPAFVPGEIARKLSGASSALLAAYVELHGRQLSLMVRRSVASTHWLHHKEPRGPRSVCDLLAERVSRAEAEVVQLVEDSGRSHRPADERKGANTALDAGMALETGSVERSLAKIFSAKVKVFGEVQLTQAHILATIIGVGLKSLVECIRLQTLGRAGLQQLQLDCHHLRPLLRRFTGSGAAQIVDSLLDEVVNAGAERSVDPSLLEPAVLDRIIASIEGM